MNKIGDWMASILYRQRRGRPFWWWRLIPKNRKSFLFWDVPFWALLLLVCLLVLVLRMLQSG